MARRDTKSYPSLLAAVLLSCLPALRVTAGLPGGAKITAVVLAQGVLLADALPPALGACPRRPDLPASVARPASTAKVSARPRRIAGRSSSSAGGASCG